jgi:hypothetical protein
LNHSHQDVGQAIVERSFIEVGFNLAASRGRATQSQGAIVDHPLTRTGQARDVTFVRQQSVLTVSN